jgi:tricorn protease
MDRIPSAPPIISPVPAGIERPLFSIMIPAYNCIGYLREAILSVLAQDQGPERMQVEVVDDCSTDGDVAALVAALGRGRVGYFRQESNVGSLRNFETCLNRSTGQLIHLLHGDDMVKPGFYREIESLFRQFSDAGAAFTGYFHVDERGEVLYSNEPLSDRPCIIEDWFNLIAVGQRVQPPAMVVRRSVYEHLGGFFGVHYGEDWEMWVRISAQYPVAHSPRHLAKYRVHGRNITSEFFVSGQNIRDVAKAIEIVKGYLPEDKREKLYDRAKRHFSRYFARTSDMVYHSYRNPARALAQAKDAFRMSRNPTTLYFVFKMYIKMLIRYRRILLALLFAIGGFGGVSAQEHPLWLRYPALSPDGKTILFSYKGDIYSVPAEGGTAVPMTISESYEFAPVWSHDGKWIAFASDRYGNFDVFVMPSTGGEARRLTYHSGNEIPSSFTADDKRVLFSASRQDLVTDAQFPVPEMSELYSVPIVGGRVDQVLPVPALHATVSSDGARIIYEDQKGYENEWRKHHTSSIARDIWLYDTRSGKYTMLTSFKGEDRNPVFGSDDKEYYYLSEQSGSFNVYRGSVADVAASVALTHFSKHPVRFLTRANDKTLCFGFDGEIYTMRPGGEPRKVEIRIGEDGRMNLEKMVPVNGGVTEMKLSPNGKEVAFVFRGEIFVTSVVGGITKRITNTPWQERSVTFSPDGRSLLFAAEKNSNWNVYTLSIARKEEPYFFASTVLKEETVVATPAEEFQPAYSPDGKEVAYLEDRVTLKVINLASKQTRVVLPADNNYSYADGDQYYQWSPDGKWFLVQYGLHDRTMAPEVGLVAADGKSPVIDLTLSGYSDVLPKWEMDGKMMTWASDREGARQQGGGTITGDVYGMFFSKDAFDRWKLSKEEFALLKEVEDKEAKEQKDAEETKAKAGTGKKAAKDSTKKDSVKEIKIDWDNLTDRKLRLTTHTSDAADWLLSKDGEKLYYLSKFEKGYDLWMTEVRTRETKLFAKLGARYAGMQLSGDGKFILVLAEGRITKIDAESGKMEPIGINGEMALKEADEKAYIFDHAWRQMKEKFYVVNMNGVDWDFYYTTYKKFLPYINNDYDFAEMLSEMLGELNVSHTGCYYGEDRPSGDQTASLGIFYDYAYKGPGLKIAEVIADGPLDKHSAKVRPGVILEKIDGEAITDTVDHYMYLNRKARKLVLLSLYDPATGARWEETMKPVTLDDEGELLYRRWVNQRRKETDSLSKGRIGYVHVRAMNDESMRTVFEEALGRAFAKDALIVDTRFNGGGNIHEQLSDFLNGKKYFDIIPHGQYVGSEPYEKWVKPSIVLIGEANYSDAHLFPAAYKLKNIGKTLGMPIPGTGTFVWWEQQIDPNLVFGMPMGGWRSPDGLFEEGHQLEPDIMVRNEPDRISAGNDQQIDAAVKELIKK